MTTSVKIPQRAVYRAAEVCAIAQLQPYVLRSWEAEFADLGVAKTGSQVRVYRRVDLDKVLRIKELLFVEGLTLGAARRKLMKETPSTDAGELVPFEELLSADARGRVEDVKAGLRSILTMLASNGDDDGAATGARAPEPPVVKAKSTTVAAQASRPRRQAPAVATKATRKRA